MTRLIALVIGIACLSGCSNEVSGPASAPSAFAPTLNDLPEWSPSGRYIAFVHYNYVAPSLYEIWIYDCVTDSSHYVTRGTAPSWEPDEAHLLYVDQFAIKRVERSGGVPEVLFSAGLNLTPAAAPNSDSIAFASDSQSPYFDIVIVNRTSNQVTDVTPSRSGREPAWSHDGTRLLFARYETHGARLFSLSLLDSQEVQLTFPGADDHWPVWSRDDEHILWSRNPLNQELISVWRAKPDGSQAEKLITGAWSPSPSPLDTAIVCGLYDQESNTNDVWICSWAGVRQRRLMPLSQSFTAQCDPSWERIRP